MSEKWTQGMLRYIQAQTETKQPVKQENITVREDSETVLALQIEQAAEDLEKFLSSPDGGRALALLGAAKRHIIFGEESEGGEAHVTFIDSAGLGYSVEPSGWWTAYAKKEDLKPPRAMLASPRQAIQAALWHSKRKPLEVLPWLRQELDKIADAAPEAKQVTT